jgi:hypothetical protein
MNTTAVRYNEYIVVRVAAAANPETEATGLAGAEPATPLHIGLVIDTSGSMGGERIHSVKRTLEAARPLFTETDTVTLVTFNDVGTTLLARHRMDTDGIERFYQTVNDIAVGGSTNLSAGLERLVEVGTDYTTLVLLTDGHINAGVTSVSGLKAMTLGACRNAINTLGYGPDHSRTLLSQLAIHSRGSYTYADTDEVLPVIIGDILAGVRNEAFRQVEVSVPAGEPVCLEIGSGGPTHTIGNIVADRDYWTVFKCAGVSGAAAVATVRVSAAGGPVLETPVTDSSGADIQEQVLRCRVAAAIAGVSTLLEGFGTTSVRIDDTRNSLEALKTEIAALPEDVRQRALVLRMTGQIAEALDALTSVSAHPLDGGRGGGAGLRRCGVAHLAARMSSGVACLATQRGVYSSGGAGGDPADACLFSSPAQRSGSQAVHATYSQQDPADAVIAPSRAAALPGASGLQRSGAGMPMGLPPVMESPPTGPPIAPTFVPTPVRSAASPGVAAPP